jgi:acylphosphatase
MSNEECRISAFDSHSAFFIQHSSFCTYEILARLNMPPEAKNLQTRRYLVRGRVQGVGFRWFVEREAHTLGIYGWVRNTFDGSVEVLATGTREQLASLRHRLQQGPRAARVDEVEESEANPVEGLHTFRIEGAW